MIKEFYFRQPPRIELAGISIRRARLRDSRPSNACWLLRWRHLFVGTLTAHNPGRCRVHFNTLISELPRQDLVDAQRSFAEMLAEIQQNPLLASEFPDDYALTFMRKTLAADGIERAIWMWIVIGLLDCAPRLALPLLASEEPNASFLILSYMRAIGRGASEDLQQQIIDAMLTLMNDGRPEAEVSGRIYLGDNLDHDSADERLKFRKAAAKALIDIASDWGRCSISDIGRGLLAICENPSSIACARAAIAASAAIPLDPVVSFRCISTGLYSTDTGILKETGLAIVRCASRIGSAWSDAATHSVVEGLAHQSWIARKPLAEALLALSVNGFQPAAADIFVLILRICQADEQFQAIRAAEFQLAGRGGTAQLSREARELDADVRSVLYQVVHQTLSSLPRDLIEDIALFVSDILQSGSFDAERFRMKSVGIEELDSPDYWESHLTGLLDECLGIAET